MWNSKMVFYLVKRSCNMKSNLVMKRSKLLIKKFKKIIEYKAKIEVDKAEEQFISTIFVRPNRMVNIELILRNNYVYGTYLPVFSLRVRFGYCFTPYQRLWLYNGAPLVAFYDTLGIRRTYSRLKPPVSSRGREYGGSSV